MERDRNINGQYRKKRSDTHVETVEKLYNRDFDVKGNMHLDTLLEKLGVESLNDLITGK